jgi:hypothetical protein
VEQSPDKKMLQAKLHELDAQTQQAGITPGRLTPIEQIILPRQLGHIICSAFAGI